MTRTMRASGRARAALAGVVSLALLAGCDGGGGGSSTTPPTTASSTWSATTPSTTSATSSTATSSETTTAYVPVKPEFPAAAKKQTLKSAEAFARYFYELLNYAFTKPEAGLIKPLSEAGCEPCAYFEDESHDLVRDERRYASAILTIKQVNFSTEDVQNPWVTVSGQQNKVPLIEKDGSLTDASPAAKVTFRVVLRWTPAGWRVEDLVNV